MPADQDVRLGVLEHVPHVEIAGDVGRGQQDSEGARASGAWGGCLDFEEMLVDPVFCPALLDGGGVVGLGQFTAGLGGLVHGGWFGGAAFECIFSLLRHSLFTI